MDGKLGIVPAQAEFASDVAAVGLHGLRRDVEEFGDLLGAVARPHQPADLQFRKGQLAQSVLRPLFAAVGQREQAVAQKLIMDLRAAASGSLPICSRAGQQQPARYGRKLVAAAVPLGVDGGQHRAERDVQFFLTRFFLSRRAAAWRPMAFFHHLPLQHLRRDVGQQHEVLPGAGEADPAQRGDGQPEEQAVAERLTSTVCRWGSNGRILPGPRPQGPGLPDGLALYAFSGVLTQRALAVVMRQFSSITSTPSEVVLKMFLEAAFFQREQTQQHHSGGDVRRRGGLPDAGHLPQAGFRPEHFKGMGVQAQEFRRRRGCDPRGMSAQRRGSRASASSSAMMKVLKQPRYMATVTPRRQWRKPDSSRASAQPPAFSRSVSKVGGCSAGGMPQDGRQKVPAGGHASRRAGPW